MEDAKGSILEAQGELITTQYFDSLAAEVNELLQVGPAHRIYLALMNVSRTLPLQHELLEAVYTVMAVLPFLLMVLQMCPCFALCSSSCFLLLSALC